MFKKILILTSILVLASCQGNFLKKNKFFSKEKDNEVVFDFQNQVLSKEAKTALANLAMKLKDQSGKKVLVEANCDKSLSGSKKYNIGIAKKRANITKAYLVKSGVDASRIETATNGADKGSAKNFKSKNNCTITIAKK